jgi:hypothetical protein
LMSGEREDKSRRWTHVGREGASVFLQLLGKGVITPPRREQLRAISPVVLNVVAPSLRLDQHSANGHAEQGWNRDGTDVRPWPFERLDCYWGMAPLPPTDVSTYLWDRTRREASHLPVTSPHGMVCLVPGPLAGSSSRWTTTWVTDGDSLGKNGKAFSLSDACAEIRADLDAGATRLPFRVEGRVFHQVIAQSTDRYTVVLVDPGWLDPADRNVTLTAQVPGNWTATDRLAGKTIGSVGRGLALLVPAGTFRLLELHDARPARMR